MFGSSGHELLSFLTDELDLPAVEAFICISHGHIYGSRR